MTRPRSWWTARRSRATLRHARWTWAAEPACADVLLGRWHGGSPAWTSREHVSRACHRRVLRLPGAVRRGWVPRRVPSRHRLGAAAADVFIYVGALDEVFAAVARVMRAGRCVRVLRGGQQRWRSSAAASLRYAHSEEGIHSLPVIRFRSPGDAAPLRARGASAADPGPFLVNIRVGWLDGSYAIVGFALGYPQPTRRLCDAEPERCMLGFASGLTSTAAYALRSAWSRSHRMSSTSSMPTDSRIMSGRTPARASSSSSSCRWVVDAGWITSVLASPMLARWLRNSQASMKRSPPSPHRRRGCRR